MLSDLEVDVLFAVEGRPEFAGVWRLPHRGPDALRVAVALVGFRGAGRLVGIPDGQFIRWCPVGTPGFPPPGAIALSLDDDDRARAKQRAEERLARATYEANAVAARDTRMARPSPAMPDPNLVLSDLEADVLLAIEGRPEDFFGAWRLPARDDGARVAVAITGFRGAGHLATLPNAKHIVWFQRGNPAVVAPDWVALHLDDDARLRAQQRCIDRGRAILEAPMPTFDPLSTFEVNPPDRWKRAPRPRAPRSARTIPSQPERPLPRVPALFEHGGDQWSAPLEPPNQIYEERPLPPRVPVTPEGLIATEPRDLDELVSVFHREDGSSLAAMTDSSQTGTPVIDPEPTKHLRVLVVARTEAFAHRLRELFGDTVDVTHVASGWDVLDRAEEPFDRVVWKCDAWVPGDPTEAQFFRLLAAARPTLARSTFFVVDEARRERAARETPRIAARFIGDGDVDLRRLIM